MSSLTLADAKNLVENGTNTNAKITEATGLSKGHVTKVMKEWTDAGEFDRHRDGRTFVYTVGDGTPKPTDDDADNSDGSVSAVDLSELAASSTSVDDGRRYGAFGASNDAMPTTREYDWDEYVPKTADAFIQSDAKELDRIRAVIDTRHLTGKRPRFLLTGPPGVGKTTLPTSIAFERDWPVFTIQATYSMYESDLLGSPSVVGDESTWNDGVLTKALLCAAERPTVVIIDEVNRARPEAKSVFFSALDERGEVSLSLRGGETIRAKPDNLIVFSTANIGSQFVGTQEFDWAEKRRLGKRVRLSYLPEDSEVDLIEASTPVGRGFARQLVRAANDVRRQAGDESNRLIRVGIPTSAVREWATSAYGYALAGVSDAAQLAADDDIADAFYGENPDAYEEVKSILHSRVGRADPLKGADVPSGYAVDDDDDATDEDDESLAEESGFDEDDALECDSCGKKLTVERADVYGALVTMECPDCGGDLFPAL